jgi:hypothetical protein
MQGPAVSHTVRQALASAPVNQQQSDRHRPPEYPLVQPTLPPGTASSRHVMNAAPITPQHSHNTEPPVPLYGYYGRPRPASIGNRPSVQPTVIESATQASAGWPAQRYHPYDNAELRRQQSSPYLQGTVPSTRPNASPGELVGVVAQGRMGAVQPPHWPVSAQQVASQPSRAPSQQPAQVHSTSDIALMQSVRARGYGYAIQEPQTVSRHLGLQFQGGSRHL